MMLRPAPRLAAGLVAVSLSLLGAAPAGAVGLTLKSETKPWTGVTVRKYRTSSPAADAWAVLVDLCASGIHVDATRYSGTFKATGTWAQAAGVQIATNGDFFKSSPARVYGQAVGDGVPWPVSATGYDPAYASEWYYKNAGWIAFGFDGVEYSHTELVKKSAGAPQLGGWKPTQVTETFPPGALAIVSGFPELVTEGTRVKCADPTASSCFPDRSDMRDRNPRTAMGLTQDRQTFILLVVDGRTSTSAGMYGTEEAEVMEKLGAWQALNLDGGGSSQLWKKGSGYLNDYDGNNNGAGLRSVLNHWGVFAGTGTGKPSRPGHCAASKPCEIIPPQGGTIDDDSACFRGFGTASTWRVEPVGQGGGLHWTNATSDARADNWAWWQLHFAAAGDYEVEYWAEAAYAKFQSTRYEILADGKVVPLVIDQSGGSGWRSLGTYHFAAGGGQYVRLFDNNAKVTVASGTHICADAVRLTPAGPICGDGTCAAGETCGTCEVDCGPCDPGTGGSGGGSGGTTSGTGGGAGGGPGGGALGSGGSPSGGGAGAVGSGAAPSGGSGGGTAESGGCACRASGEPATDGALSLAALGLAAAVARRRRGPRR